MFPTLFIPTFDDLLARLKLSGAADGDTLVVIDQAIRQVRAGFYKELGADRIAYIQAGVASVPPDPMTDADILHVKAEEAEALWVKLKLAVELPMLFVAGGDSIRERWNEEQLTRDLGRGDQATLIGEMSERLDELLAELRGDEDVEVGSLRASMIGPDLVFDTVGNVGILF